MTSDESPAIPCPTCGKDTHMELGIDEEWAGADDAEREQLKTIFVCPNCGEVELHPMIRANLDLR